MFNTSNQVYFNIKQTSVITDYIQIRSVFSYDGSMVAICSTDSSIIYDSKNMKVQMELTVKGVYPIFSPDDSLLLIMDTTKCTLCNVLTGKVKHTFSCHVLFSECATFSADGSKIACCDRVSSNSVYVFDTDTGEILHSLSGYNYFTMSPQFFDNGTKLLFNSGTKSELWDLKTEKLEHTFSTKSGAVFITTISPDEKTIAFCAKGVDFYNSNNVREIDKWQDTGSLVSKAIFSADSKWLLTGSRDKKIRLHRVDTGTVVKVFEGEYHFDFSKDSKSIVVADNSGINIWCISYETVKRSHTWCFSEISRSPSSVCFSPCSNKILATYQNGKSYIWEPDPSEVLQYKNSIKKVLTDEVFQGSNLSESLGGEILKFMIGV